MSPKPLKYSKDGLVSFDDASHVYTYLPTGEQLTSVTTVLKKFQTPFDPTGEILIRCAAKAGVTPEQLRQEWDDNRDLSATYGTQVHAEMEHWINTGEILFSDHSPIVARYANFRPRHLLRSETIVYSVEHGVAGQVDVPWYPGGKVVNIDDFKTDKKMEKYSPFGDRMLHGLEHLHACNYNKHTLQLSIYGYLFEQKGLQAGKLTVIHIPRLKNTFTPHPCRYLRDEAEHILQTYKNIKCKV